MWDFYPDDEYLESIKGMTNWVDLPDKAKEYCIQEMTMQTRWNLRQTCKADRKLVNTVKLFAETIELHNDFIFVIIENKHFMINYKYDRMKWLPFLTYMLSVMVIGEMKIHPDSEKWFKTLMKQLPGGQGALQIGTISKFDEKKPLTERLHQGWRRLMRCARENLNQLLHVYWKKWAPIEATLSFWMFSKNATLGSELLVYDPYMKSLEELIWSHLGRHGFRECYEEGLIGTKYGDRIIYVYKFLGSKWYHCVLLPIESDDYENTEGWTDCKFFNYKDRLSFKWN